MRERKVFKIASSSMANIKILKDQGVWAIPFRSKAYSPLVKNSEPGDAVVFTYRGEPVATGVLNSVPKEGILGIWPNTIAYGSMFSVKVNGFGRISRSERDDLEMTLPRGVVTYSDIKTYYACRSKLTPVNLSNLSEQTD